MAKKRKKKWLWIGGAIVVVVAVIAVVSLQQNGDTKTLVQADLAYIDDIAETVTASGRIQPQTKVDISAEVSAEIVGLHVNEGDFVDKGQLLMTLDTVQLQSDLHQAQFSLDETKARLAAARAQFDKDEREFERQTRLFNGKLISETEYADATYIYESSKANYDAWLAQVNINSAILDKAADNLTKTTIRSPMDGFVTFLNAEAGEIAQAQTSYTQGKRLMTIADLSVFEVEVDIDETEIAKVFLGQMAKIRVDAFRDTSFAGTVVEIGNSARVIGEGSEDYSTNFLVKVRFDKSIDGIRPGMSATTDITTAYSPDALLIPYAAVVMREFDVDSLPEGVEAPVETAQAGGINASFAVASSVGSNTSAEKTIGKKRTMVELDGVFVIKEGKAVFKQVMTGIADERNIAVLDGIQPTDTVISGSYQTLRRLAEGEAVSIDENSGKRIAEQIESISL
ncbi:MAG: efflux RND transporter periplasmic adaptor subunit [Candidatus Zixiibacteriota bacterium]